MSRKFACILLTLSVLISSFVIVYADESAQRLSDYEAAAAALSDAGMTYSTTAMGRSHGVALAVDLGMLAQRSNLSMSQLSAQALLLQQEQQRAEIETARTEAIRSAYMSLYDGVMVQTDSLPVYAAPSADAEVLRTLSAGKAGRLLDVTDGWYHISFGSSTTGWLSIDDCRGVTFADYEGTLATKDLYEAVIDYAYTYLGTPYAWGGSSYSGADCSGFTMAVFGEFGYSLSHSAQAQYNRSTAVSSAERRPGDLVFFSSYDTSGIDHVGIYLGGGRFIHSSSSYGVTINNLSDIYWCDHYLFAGRLINE